MVTTHRSFTCSSTLFALTVDTSNTVLIQLIQLIGLRVRNSLESPFNKGFQNFDTEKIDPLFCKRVDLKPRERFFNASLVGPFS